MAELFDGARPGVLITLEGVDGSGKTTQVKLLAQALRESGRECLCLREPGGTGISEQVRQLLLDPANEGMAAEAELLLYEAARAQLVREVIEPALGRGAVVICDRYYDSTFAYQAAARGLDEDMVRQANEIGSCGLRPARTVVLDIDPREAYVRAVEGGADRMESEGINFQERVREGYVRASELEPSRVYLVDATGEAEDVFARIVDALSDTVPELAELDARLFLAVQNDVERAFAEVAAAAAASAELFAKASADASASTSTGDTGVLPQVKADAAVRAMAEAEAAERARLEAEEAARAQAEAEAAARAQAEAEAEARAQAEAAARAEAEARAQAEAEARARAEEAAAARARAVAAEEAELFAQVQAAVAAEAKRLSTLDTQEFAQDAREAEYDAMASLDVLPSR